MFIMMIFFLILLIIIFTLTLINYLISKKKKNEREKNSSFECGFDPFTYSRLPFSIQFYMISMIFLIFDIEIMILLPLTPSMILSTIEQILPPLFLFMMILLISLYVEWKDGALKWIK